MFSEEFWLPVMRKEKLYMYGFAPFLEEASSLLLAAANLRPIWSLNHKKELKTLAGQLQNFSENIRRCGLGWAPNVIHFDTSPAQVLGLATFHRSYDVKEKYELPEEASMLMRVATGMLLQLIPALKEAQSTWFPEIEPVKSIYEIIERLAYSPYRDDLVKFDKDYPGDYVWRVLGRHALLLECHGLAYMQARIEDGHRKDNKKSRKKKCTMSADQINKLAEDIGVDPNHLREVLETEYSDWWNVAEKYSDLANVERAKLIEALFPNVQKKIICESWDVGSPNLRGSLFSIHESEVTASEQIIQYLICLMTQQMPGDSN